VRSKPQRSLPDLGPRGEGWFFIQVILLAAVALAGSLGSGWSGPPRAVGLVVGGCLIGLGGVLGLRGVIDLRENLTVFPRPIAGARFVDSGAYRFVRHPIYGGLILGAFGWGLVTASPAALLGAAALAIFLRLKSGREELWLADQFAEYEDYRTRTRRFVPFLY
jgi:protein-S-isoprenylcysteine O-methyltransferase Ste14